MNNKGGRPKLKTLSEMRQHASLEVENKENGGRQTNGGLASNNLKELREMWKERGEFYVAISSPQGGFNA